MDTEAGPSSKRRRTDMKKKLSDEELAYIIENELSDDDLDFIPSESEYEPSDGDFSDSDEDSPARDIRDLEFDNITPINTARNTKQNANQESRNENDGSSNPNFEKWSNESLPPNEMKSFPFRKIRELLVPVPGNKPIDFFFLLFDEDIQRHIVQETNAYAVVVLFGSCTENSRIASWKDVTLEEFRVFIGLLFHMGTIQLPRLQDYWKTDRLFNIPIFKEQMSRNRFLLILRCLHFFTEPNQVNKESRDVLQKIRPIISHFNNKMSSVYYPNKELSLDESMMLWRGRLAFRQYIKNKRHRYGIKLYMLTEPDGTTLRFHVYTGAHDVDLSGTGHASKVVQSLMEGKLNCGHSLYMDNFYNSVLLAKKLLENETYCTGTLRASLRDNPKEVTEQKLKRDENISVFNRGVHVGKWKDKRPVLYISTEYDNKFATIKTKSQKEVLKPEVIVQYNKFMSGVDHQDQLLAYYPCERKTIRWYKKLFIHVLQLFMINSYKLYLRFSGGAKISFYDFRLSVIKELLPEQVPKSTPSTSRILHKISVISEKGKGTAGSQRVKRKRCKLCSQKKIRKQTVYHCEHCDGKPGFCVACFTEYHETL